jgi:hypothetical protein
MAVTPFDFAEPSQLQRGGIGEIVNSAKTLGEACSFAFLIL